ncbi:MAG: hypothetical protein ACYTDT_01220 [Planctomycetota bacterium]|jgi:hypothetical protein
MWRVILAALILIPISSIFSAQELTKKNYEKTRDHILPNEDEEAWRKIEWRATFWEGIIDAQKADKPVMLYAMNGHPFSCT